MKRKPEEERRLVQADYAIVTETDVAYILLQKDTNAPKRMKIKEAGPDKG